MSMIWASMPRPFWGGGEVEPSEPKIMSRSCGERYFVKYVEPMSGLDK